MRPDNEAEPGPLVSVVVLTRDRPELLRRCLASIFSGDYPRIEVVVLDNGLPASRAKTRALLESMGSEGGVKLVESDPAGFAPLREKALRRAAGAIVMSIDDDCTAEPEAISAIVARFAADAELGVLGGQLVNVGFEGEERLKGRGRLGNNASYETVEDPTDADVFGSANHSILRRAFDELGGYDPFFVDGMEEADLILGIRRLGYRVAYAPEVRIVHRHSPVRHRRRWRSLNSMRLYLFFKHFMPRGAAEWARFLWRELGLVIRDALRLVKALPHRLSGVSGATGWLRRAASTAIWLALEGLEIVVARLRVPWLVARARTARARMGLP